MLRLSELLGSEVLSSTGTVVGRLVDLTVELGEPSPTIARLAVGRRRQTLARRLGAGLILVPVVPLVTILVLSQVPNDVLLLPLMVFMHGLARHRGLMGEHVATRWQAASYLCTIVMIDACKPSLCVLSAL